MTHAPHPKVSRPIDWQRLLVLAALGVIAAAGALFLSSKESPSITISVPARDLPMYHLITNTDLMAISIPLAELSSKTLRSDTELVDHYTKVPLVAGKAVLSTQLISSVDPALNINTTVVSIPSTKAMAFGGRLTTENNIMLWEVPVNNTTSTANLLLDQVLVLDVLPMSPAPIGNTEAISYVVILAVPVNRQADILSAAAKGSLVFTLRP